MTDASSFEFAAQRLLEKLKLPHGAVTIRQTRDRRGHNILVADIEPGALPEEKPKDIGDYRVKYRKRKILRAF